MNQIIRNILSRGSKLVLKKDVRNRLSIKLQQRDVIKEWIRAGRSVPPPHVVKQGVLKQYGKRFKLDILVETGTYYGDMVDAMKDTFSKIYSVELGDDLYNTARQRFKSTTNVHLLHGDSATILGDLLPRIYEPALFWLDGHYSAGVTARGSKDTPIFEELTHILAKNDLRHVILIDDARCFGTEKEYPTVDELTRFIKSRRPLADIVVQDDIIRVVSPKT